MSDLLDLIHDTLAAEQGCRHPKVGTPTCEVIVAKMDTRTADPGGLRDIMAVKDAVMRLPTHVHIFNDTPYLRRLDVLDLIDTLFLAALTPEATAPGGPK